MVTWTVLVTYGVHWLLQRSGWNPRSILLPATMLLSTAPGGLVTTTEMATNCKQDLLGISVLTAIITHLVLARVYIARFGRVTNLEIRSPENAERKVGQMDWLGLPRRSKLCAIAWKQSRESGPIVLATLGGIVGIVALVSLLRWYDNSPTRIAEVYVPTALVLGFVMAMVIGIGICFYDVNPQINLFWRSRPIDPNTWFWCKYVTGLIVLLAAIYVPIFVLKAIDDRPIFNPADQKQLFVIPLAQIAIFAAAVAMTCLVRHAVYAAILSIAFVFLPFFVVSGVWYVMGIMGLVKSYRTFWEPMASNAAFGLVLSFCIGTVLAWLAMRYDWGRKSRY